MHMHIIYIYIYIYNVCIYICILYIIYIYKFIYIYVYIYLKRRNFRNFTILSTFAKINHARFKPFFRNFEKPFGTLCFSKAKKGEK